MTTFIYGSEFASLLFAYFHFGMEKMCDNELPHCERYLYVLKTIGVAAQLTPFYAFGMFFCFIYTLFSCMRKRLNVLL